MSEKTGKGPAGKESAGEERIGHYTIVSELGRGGMGVVYKAHEESLNRLVALKVLGKHLSEDESFVARFKREAQSAAALNHPNIVQVYAISEFDGQHCFAMEFVRGLSVQQVIRKNGPMDPVKAARLILQAASGLGAAHGKGIYHRDIKPANLMVDESGLLKIADFGLAILAAGTTQLTATGMFMGTPGYLSPEQCLGESVDQRTDIYALGVTLYEMLTGETPLKADSPLALLRQIIDVEPRDVGELRPEVPESLRSILRKMMAKKPDDRYADCATLITDLQHWLVTQGAHASELKTTYSAPESSGHANDEATIIAPRQKSKEKTVETPLLGATTSTTRRNSMSALVIALVLLVVAGASYATWKYVVNQPGQGLAVSTSASDAETTESMTPETGMEMDDPTVQVASTSQGGVPVEDGNPQFASSQYPESDSYSEVDQLDLQAPDEGWTYDYALVDSDVATEVLADMGMDYASVSAVEAEDSELDQMASVDTLIESGASNLTGSDALAANSVDSDIVAPKPVVTQPVVGTGVALVSIGEVLLADSAADFVRQTLSRHGIPVIDGMSIPGVADMLANGGGDLQSLVRPVARYLVYIRADFTTERQLYYMGRPDIELQSRLNLETNDLLNGQPMGEGVHATVGYTALSVEGKVQELLRPKFGPVAVQLTQ